MPALENRAGANREAIFSLVAAIEAVLASRYPTAFEAISATMPLGSVGFEREPSERGERVIWLDAVVVDRLAALRGPGESFSDVILRLVEREPRLGVRSFAEGS